MARQDETDDVSGIEAAADRSPAEGGGAASPEAAASPASRDDAVEAEPATLRAIITAQRWDIAGLKEQLGRAVEERDRAIEANQQSDEAHAAEIAALRRALGDAEADARAATAQATIYRGMFDRLHGAISRDLWTAFPRPAAGVRLFRAMVTIWQSGLFDEPYYRRQCALGDIPDGMPALVHYLLHGERRGRNPHPLFDVRHYRGQLGPGEARDGALLHYLDHGHDLAPNPLFDVGYYRAQHGALADAAINPLVHYLTVGSAAGSSPHPLFDAGYYGGRITAAGGEPPPQPLAHYLAGAAPGTSPHPLFDAGFYLAGHPEAGVAGMPPLVHFLVDGERRGWKPHPWFDPPYYRDTNPDVAEAGINTLVHFVLVGADRERSPSPAFKFAFCRARCGEAAAGQSGYRLFLDFLAAGVAAGRSPHPLIDLAAITRQLGGAPLDPDSLWRVLSAQRVAIQHAPAGAVSPGRVPAPHWLFDADYYQKQVPAAAGFADGPLLFYLSRGWRGEGKPHPLFDPAYYRAQAARRGIAVDDPLTHFVETGGRLGLSPHPLFDAGFYLAANPGLAPGTNPLRHYLTLGDRLGRDPHPLFSVADYRAGAKPGFGVNSLIHYLAAGAAAGIDPHPLFDTAYYLAQLKGAPSPQTTPLTHYLTDPEGMRASPHPLFDPDYFRGELGAPIPDGTAPLMHYLTQPAAGTAAPHPAFDPVFFDDGSAPATGPKPALAAYVSAWRELQRHGLVLQRIRLREANPEFCSISYLLDHLQLLDGGEIPLVHHLRRNGWPGGAEGQRRRSGPPARSPDAIAEGYHPAALEPAAYRDAARAQLKRGLAYLGDRDPVFRLRQSAWADGFAALWQAAAPQATAAGDDAVLIGRVKATRRIALFAIDSADGRLKSWHQSMLSGLDAAGYTTILINPTTTGAAALARAASDKAAAVILRSGSGGDFASWLVALLHFAPALAEADHVLLLNDGLVGPFGELGPLLRTLENHPADCLGLTESLEGGRHWQRGFLYFSRHALFSSGFLQFMLELPPRLASGDRDDHIARHAEILLFARLTAAGIATAAWLPYADSERDWLASLPERLARAAALPENLRAWRLDRLISDTLAPRLAAYLGDWLIERAAFLRAGERVDPQHLFWDALYDAASFPFIAKELLLTNPAHIPTVIFLPDLLARHGRTQDAALLRDLSPPTTDRPTAYFRLSPRLIEAIA